MVHVLDSKDRITEISLIKMRTVTRIFTHIVGAPNVSRSSKSKLAIFVIPVCDSACFNRYMYSKSEFRGCKNI